MNLSALTPFGALVLGCALRYLLPYVTTGFQAIRDGGWSAWPKFEPAYLSGFVLGVLGFVVTFVTSQGAVEALMAMPFTAAVLLGYSGGEAAREVVKLIVPRAR